MLFYQNPGNVFFTHRKAYSKMYIKREDSRIANTIVKNVNKVKGFILPKFKTPI